MRSTTLVMRELDRNAGREMMERMVNETAYGGLDYLKLFRKA